MSLHADHRVNFRRHIRYRPDQLQHALVMLRADAEVFEPDEVALILDEAAMSGAQLVMRLRPGLDSGAMVVVQLGRLEPVRAEVVWARPIEKDLVRIGLRFLE